MANIFNYGLARGLAYKHDWNADMNRAMQLTQLQAQRNKEKKAEAAYMADLTKLTPMSHPYIRGQYQKYANGILKEIGEYKHTHPSYRYNPDEMNHLSQLSYKLSNNEFVDANNYYMANLKKLQEAKIKDPKKYDEEFQKLNASLNYQGDWRGFQLGGKNYTYNSTEYKSLPELSKDFKFKADLVPTASGNSLVIDEDRFGKAAMTFYSSNREAIDYNYDKMDPAMKQNFINAYDYTQNYLRNNIQVGTKSKSKGSTFNFDLGNKKAKTNSFAYNNIINNPDGIIRDDQSAIALVPYKVDTATGRTYLQENVGLQIKLGDNVFGKYKFTNPTLESCANGYLGKDNITWALHPIIKIFEDDGNNTHIINDIKTKMEEAGLSALDKRNVMYETGVGTGEYYINGAWLYKQLTPEDLAKYDKVYGKTQGAGFYSDIVNTVQSRSAKVVPQGFKRVQFLDVKLGGKPVTGYYNENTNEILTDQLNKPKLKDKDKYIKSEKTIIASGSKNQPNKPAVLYTTQAEIDKAVNNARQEDPTMTQEKYLKLVEEQTNKKYIIE